MTKIPFSSVAQQGVGTPLDIVLYAYQSENGWWHERTDSWAVEPSADFPEEADHTYRHSSASLSAFTVVTANALGLVTIRHRRATAQAISMDRELAAEMLSLLRKLCPVAEGNESEIPVSFWAHGHNGPQEWSRMLDRVPWEEVEDNYPVETRKHLAEMMDPGWRPGSGGQLILWSGPPGTGKTHALCTLVHQWRDWCDVHYVADPDKFFGSHADYMLSVMLDERNAPMHFEGEDESDDGPERWRLLILEDTGELLRKDAKEQVGQALSRFLNVVDGLIGRGLRIMVLVTTNEEVTALHEAVARPGRCAADIRFGSFHWMKAEAWLEAHGASVGLGARDHTLAELYAHVNGTRGADGRRAPIGFSV